MKTVLFIAALASAIQAQTVDLNRTVCANTDPTKPRALVIVPIASIQVPLCLVIGAGLRVNMNATGGPALESASASSLVPVAETISLDSATVPLTQARLAFRLKSPPAANTFLVVVFRSASFPGDTVEIVTNPVRDLDIALPALRSDRGDKIELRYFTN